ncbi:MAG: AMP-binding protein [Rhizobiales bacterium]|nr:AMP-binding protein [Hyphomicrobiales bacterium]
MTWTIPQGTLSREAFTREPASGRYRISIPPRLNMAEVLVGRNARGPLADRPALLLEAGDGQVTAISYRELEERACRLAGALVSLGVGFGDRVAIHSAQRPETIVAHLATYKLGAIAATISALSGPDTIAHILDNSGARVIVTTDALWQPQRPLRAGFSRLEHVLVAGDTQAGEIGLAHAMARAEPHTAVADTGPEDGALLIYTSGSTGRPKGILHGHRILPALNATLELFYQLELREPGAVMWTGADWAWIGGLNDVVFPALTYGHRLVVSEHRFDPEWALDLMARHGVTHSLLTPTALKRLLQVPNPRARFDLSLRVFFTGGEPLPGDTHRGLAEQLGVVCNEGYGLSEVNQMIGNCQRLRPVKPGSMGWEYPGHRVVLVAEDGTPVARGDVGEVCVTDDDPTLFLGYWGEPGLTADMRLPGGLVRTRDLAVEDEDGYFWYRGRNDDLIKSAGFRIGPAEIEEALQYHPAVADSGVIGVPDPERGQIVKAFVLLAAGHAPSDALAEELARHVKERIGPYKQPRAFEFVSELPTTRSGKVSRSELRRMERERREAEGS